MKLGDSKFFFAMNKLNSYLSTNFFEIIIDIVCISYLTISWRSISNSNVYFYPLFIIVGYIYHHHVARISLTLSLSLSISLCLSLCLSLAICLYLPPLSASLKTTSCVHTELL